MAIHLITGVSSGIGHALSQHYLERGETVLGVSRRTPDQLLNYTQFYFAPLDLTESAKVKPTLEALLAAPFRGRQEPLATVILNAGQLGQIADMGQISVAELDRLMHVNVWANKTVLDALQTMQVNVKQVVLISSGAAVKGNRGWGGYAISKAAVNMLAQLYAAEWPTAHFAAVAPGLVDTAMQEYLCTHPQDPRYASLDFLRSKRHTHEMPTPEVAAARLLEVIPRLPELIPSGQFIDVRQIS
jgi:NAD(P)-dependent dehydrogenase (short-subunit alcohol dehydrogenase family)